MIIGINLIFILSLILIFILFICWFIFKKNNDNISALSYVKVNNNVPKNELLFKFVDTYNDNKYTDYFNKIINLKLQRTPVFVIKKVDNTYEYEVYFYRYDPNRKSKYKNGEYLTIVLDNYETFTKKQEFDKLDVKPYNNKLFKENEFIIVSYDVNENFFNNNKLTYNYYFENENENYLFIKEEDTEGNIVTTYKYGLFSILFEIEDKKKYLVDLFETDDCIIFYAYKPKTNTHALYYEKSTFDKFILFLEYFKYDNNIIDFCKYKYNNTYDFCFSYDLDDKFNIKKTAIFSIF